MSFKNHLIAATAFAALVVVPGFAAAQTEQPKSTPTMDDTPQAVLTEALGLIGGLQLYQSYLNIGMLADGMAEGLYQSNEAFELLGSVVAPLEQVEKQLDRVGKLQ